MVTALLYWLALLVLLLALARAAAQHRWWEAVAMGGLALALLADDAAPLVWLGLALAAVGTGYPLWRRYRKWPV